MKLFPKLALTVSVLVIGTTVCLGISFYFTELRTIRAAAEQERRTLVQNLVHITQESLLTNDDLLLVKYTHWLEKWNPTLTSASVTTPQGEVLAHSEPTQIGTISEARMVVDMKDTLLVSQAVHLGKRWVANVSAGFSEPALATALQDRLLAFRRRIGWILSLAATAGIIISFLVARSWIKPIESLARAARDIGRGRFQLYLDEELKRGDELGDLAASFESMAKDLQQLDQMKEDFVSAVTHELRSPLSAIESYLNLMITEIREDNTPLAWSEYIERMRTNTHRLTCFVNDLLDVAALERGKVALHKKWTDPAPLINEVAGFYAPKMKERELLCRTKQTPGPMPPVWLDPDKIRQVIHNLLANAIKYTGDRGTIELGVLQVKAKRSLLFYVKDSGIGIAPEDQERLFNTFEQVISARRSVQGPKGTGLGLAISRALIELHGGSIGVSSKPGSGSCFYFTLPLEDPRK